MKGNKMEKETCEDFYKHKRNILQKGYHHGITLYFDIVQKVREKSNK